MAWNDMLRADPTPWLLEPDDPGVRYLALRDVIGEDEDSQILMRARHLAHSEGPIGEVLSHMGDEGYWVEPGPGYGPKYRGTVWAIITLAQMGGRVEEDDRIRTATEYVLGHAFTSEGQFSSTGTPGGTADCLQGNLSASLLQLGVGGEWVERAFDWTARTVTGEGMAPPSERGEERRYFAGKFGPTFRCGANNKLPCAWGAVKVMLAFSALPPESRSDMDRRAIEEGLEFLFGVDPATSAYPTGYNDKPSRNWWKFGFPVFYITDLLQLVESVVALGYGDDPRLESAVDLILSKQDEAGRWPLEYDYEGKTWIDAGKKKQPNKWVTLRALRALKGIS